MRIFSNRIAANRRAASAAVWAAAALFSVGGCGWVDEIGGAPTAHAEAQAKGEESGANTARAKLQAYYSRRPRRRAEADPADPIVRCRGSSGTRYLRKHDCTLQGGHVLE